MPKSQSKSGGIAVHVESNYIPDQSSPTAHRYVFAYTVRIENSGDQPAQLRSRHWVITDATGKKEEVRGAGVVGKQPLLHPGDAFEYTSGCVLETPRGEMRGAYQMFRPDGTEFDATIAPFVLELPHSLN
jgi:ApaG protein